MSKGSEPNSSKHAPSADTYRTTDRVGVAVTLCTRIRQVLGSNPDRDSGYLYLWKVFVIILSPLK
jgi:hypothetical protein